MPDPPYLRTTQAAYDTVAVDYAELLSAGLAAKPLATAPPPADCTSSANAP